MSLNHLRNRRDPTTFGADLNVLLGDVTITGDLVIDGVINGKSAQGQNLNNIWTGTNEFSVKRPACVPVTGVGFSGVNSGLEQDTILADSIINQGADFTGANSFTSPILFPNVPTPTPVNATDGVPTSYITSQFITKQQSFLSANNTWTNTNTFSKLPVVLDPVADTQVATKAYVDSQLATVVQGRTDTIVSQVALTSETFSTALACSIQLIGAGGGSTSGIGADCSSAGVAGASGSACSLVILNKALGGASGGQWSISIGTGGAGASCGGTGGSGNGGPTNLSVVPVAGNGLNPASVNVVRANGGGGCPELCGSNGKSGGGTYSAINPLVTSPLCASSGVGGVQCGASPPQYTGINTYGWGNRSGVNKNGGPGVNGGYGITTYLG
jgi:hypothetical protein